MAFWEYKLFQKKLDSKIKNMIFEKKKIFFFFKLVMNCL